MKRREEVTFEPIRPSGVTRCSICERPLFRDVYRVGRSRPFRFVCDCCSESLAVKPFCEEAL